MDRDECYKFKYFDLSLVNSKYVKDDKLNHVEPVNFINKKQIIGFAINEMIRTLNSNEGGVLSISHPQGDKLPVDVEKLPEDSIFYIAVLTLTDGKSFRIRDNNIDTLLMKLQDYDIFVHRTGDSMHPSESEKFCKKCKVLDYCNENDIRPSKCRKCLLCFEACNFIQKEEEENADNMSNVIS